MREFDHQVDHWIWNCRSETIYAYKEHREHPKIVYYEIRFIQKRSFLKHEWSRHHHRHWIPPPQWHLQSHRPTLSTITVAFDRYKGLECYTEQKTLLLFFETKSILHDQYQCDNASGHGNDENKTNEPIERCTVDLYTSNGANDHIEILNERNATECFAWK